MKIAGILNAPKGTELKSSHLIYTKQKLTIMLRHTAIICLILGWSAIAFAKEEYPEHPHETIEDLFHDLESEEDANRLVDKVLEHAYRQLDSDGIDLPDRQIDLGHVVPDGKGTLSRGTLKGYRDVKRLGNSQFHFEGDPGKETMTVRTTVIFPELRVRYNKAVVETTGGEIAHQAVLEGTYKQVRVGLVISHRHDPEHENTIDEFEIKGYRESKFEFKRDKEASRKLLRYKVSDAMEELRVLLLKTVEQTLKKTLEDHISDWR